MVGRDSGTAASGSEPAPDGTAQDGLLPEEVAADAATTDAPEAGRDSPGTDTAIVARNATLEGDTARISMVKGTWPCR